MDLPPHMITEKDYYYIREHMDKNPPLTGFALIGCSFAGKWKGAFARDSRGRNFALTAARSLERQRDNLHGVTFTCRDYDVLDVPYGAVVYCDPPYRGKTNGYYDRSFNYDKFLEWVERNKHNYSIYISEYAENNVMNYPVIWKRKSSTCVRNKLGKQIATTEVLLFASPD